MAICPEYLFKTHHQPNAILLPWLTHSDSLTEKLKAEAGCVDLQVLRQSWAKTSWWEANVLTVDEPDIFCREVLISSHNNPCWYAKSMIPLSTYQANKSLFEKLSSQPLGELIFNNPNIIRTQLIYYSIKEECSEYHWLSQNVHIGHQLLWARLAAYEVNKKYPFYLLEILLPGIPGYTL